MKALVLSGGSGTRLRPLTHTRSKHLIPLANRPILHHVLDKIGESGLKDVVVVLGANGKEIQESIGDGSEWGINFSYVEQKQPLGLAHAVKTARPLLKDEPFVMFLGDNILPEGILPYLRYFESETPDALVLLHPVNNPSAYGIALIKDHKVQQLLEKPQSPPSNLALIGVYFFSPKIHQAIDRIKPSPRGELEITDAIQDLLEQGGRIEAQTIQGPWFDTGTPEDLLDANQMFLDHLIPINLNEINPSTTINGPVTLGEGSIIEDSCIVGPVIIGSNCRIIRSYVGPYTALGNKVHLEDSGVERSIILDQCQIIKVPRLIQSILGTSTQLREIERLPTGLKVQSADHTKMWL